MTKRTQIIVPTAINVLTLVNDAVLAARRAGDPVNIVLPSLRKRAKLVVNEEGTLQVTTGTAPTNPSSFTR